MPTLLRTMAVTGILALLGCTAFAPSVVANMTEEVLPGYQEERAHTAEVPVFDPANLRSRSHLARNLEAQVATAWHWASPFGAHEYVLEVAVPPPKA